MAPSPRKLACKLSVLMPNATNTATVWPDVHSPNPATIFFHKTALVPVKIADIATRNTSFPNRPSKIARLKAKHAA
jgi:hypothetical protein